MEQNSLTPDQAIQYLKVRYNKPLQKSYMAKLRSAGGGPEFFRIGASVYYEQIALDRWIHHKQSPKGYSVTHIAAIEAGNIHKIENDELYLFDCDDGWIELD